MNSETRICQNCKKDFIIEPDDFRFYEKINVPAPTFCPECRQKRRFTWRNNLSLYNRICDMCGQGVVTLYSKESNIVVYCNKCWWSDKWNPLDYGQDYDFSKPFFQQFDELMYKVPHLAIINDNGIASTNCEYTHDGWFSKNCYMVFYMWHIENCMYCAYVIDGFKDSVDCLQIYDKAEQLYECINCERSYRTRNSQQAIVCMDSYFLYDCRECSNCFLCAGLRNKKYYFKNKQYSKEEYEKILEKYKLDTFSGVEKAQEEYDKFILNYPRRHASIFHSFNCTGDFLIDGKNSQMCFYSKNPENCKYQDRGTKPKDSYDTSTAGELSQCYDSITVDHSDKNCFGIFSVKSQDLFYTQHCHSSKYLFGCISVKHGQYSILNKIYSEEEYYEILGKIIQQMNDIPYIDKNGINYKFGEFYPSELSPFGYNETVAQEHFFLSKEEAIKKGYNWQDNIQRTTDKGTLDFKQIPESIKDVNDSILNEILSCIECNRNYKIIKNELIFYKKHNIPIPRKCFYCRHFNRIQRCNPLKLWHRTCMKEGCNNEFETSYSPERPEIVYCEKCYQQEVY